MVQGFLESLFRRLNLNLEVPCYTQMSRRSASLGVPLRKLPPKGALDIVVDSTGLKVYGEGEWKVRAHGKGKRRHWRKVHLAYDILDHEIVAVKSTPDSWDDGQMMALLVDQAQQNEPVGRVFGDGAYNTSDCYRECCERGCRLISPPPINAVEQGREKVPWLKPRDESVRRIAELEGLLGSKEEARARWKYEVDYHQRSLAETGMYRLKTMMGSGLWSRKALTQDTEIAIKVNLVNAFTRLGMPESIPSLAS